MKIYSMRGLFPCHCEGTEQLQLTKISGRKPAEYSGGEKEG